MEKGLQTTEKKLTQADILERGWTKGMIGRLLPEPTLARNKYCRQHPIKLWEERVVEEIEKTKEFREATEKVKNLRSGGYKAASTRREALEKDFEAAKQAISIPLIEDATLRQWVCQSKREYNVERGWFESHPEDAPEETMQRWVVNFIRHNLVSYDYTLYVNKGRVGIKECYTDYKNTILMKIAEVYPQYADECKRQMI